MGPVEALGGPKGPPQTPKTLETRTINRLAREQELFLSHMIKNKRVLGVFVCLERASVREPLAEETVSEELSRILGAPPLWYNLRIFPFLYAHA